jgi:hypothetical protein
MNSNDFRNNIVALACWRAARTELPAVMLSVGMVFKNRAEAGWFDEDLYANATHWLVENPGEFPDPRDPQFQQMLSKLDLVLSGEVPDKTGGAMWFFPKENLTVVPETFTITSTIGNLVFLKLK